ncbi:GNAT family N-acetyltransferase [Nocardia terpenica]|uniref:N-acetyltransferase domain-containing protein n=1 Tax=Nocardia terpenica TaxID=455432 RepID=A0A164NHK5_9NOCA|nr:GNAT family N-acetyltransferase [Nocardia terpenica]KZM74372.1 hypothetical protein AWN90_25150 [Nocardia terpenica]
MQTTVRAAEACETGKLGQVLGRAFADDPIIGWLIPSETNRARRAAIMFTTMARHHYLRHGGADVACDETGEIVGAALWSPPGHWDIPLSELGRMLPGLTLSLRSRLLASARMSERMAQAHPTEPHWYLGFIGTLPKVRGQGVGHALLAARLTRCDELGAPTYLESSKPSNVPYYARYGFELTREVDVTGGGPPMWPMWRPPQD